MAWSTQQVAALAGTTVNTVRHYHRIGLIVPPDRLPNGYKLYGVSHLVRLLHIRRLRSLGVPLDRVDEVSAGGDASSAVLRSVDDELAARITQLQKARDDIGAILTTGAGADVPPGLGDVAETLSAQERALMLIYGQMYDEAAMNDVHRMLKAEPDEAGEALDALPADADADTRQRLAESFALTIARHREAYPWINDPAEHLVLDARLARATFVKSVDALFNAAQLDVLGRAALIARSSTAPDRPEHSP